MYAKFDVILDHISRMSHPHVRREMYSTEFIESTLPSASDRVLLGCFLDASWMLIGCWLGARHPTLCPIHACLPGKNERRDKKPAGKNGAGKKGGKKKFSKKGGKGR